MWCVIIDDSLKWTNHISDIKNQIAKEFGHHRARNSFNHKTFLNLYYSSIMSCLGYCVKICGNAADTCIYLIPLIKSN